MKFSFFGQTLGVVRPVSVFKKQDKKFLVDEIRFLFPRNLQPAHRGMSKFLTIELIVCVTLRETKGLKILRDLSPVQLSVSTSSGSR